jgi:hypothetical protein
MTGFANIGPDLRPYNSLSDYARNANKDESPIYGGTRQIFYSEQKNPKLVPCPYAPKNQPVVLGNSVALAIIHHCVECPDGRIKGSLELGDAHKRYDFACCTHLPPDQRHNLASPQGRHHSFSPDAATCFYCNFPDHIDPEYQPSPENKNTNPPPVV